MPDRSLLMDLVLGEIGGKNNAIQAYDRILWTIRSGYLALFFAAWGIFLTAYAESSQGKNMLVALPALLWVSAGLATGGFINDISYLYRKFRVIHDLNQLMQKLIEKADLMDSPEFRHAIKEYMVVSGDIGEGKFVSKGWWLAFLAGTSIYVIPPTCLLLGLSAADLIFNGY